MENFMRSFLLATALFCYQLSGFAQQNDITTIAFGSCSDEDNPQEIWKSVLQQNPQLWIWLGDNIYADTLNMSVMEEKYQHQKSNPDYQKLLATCPVIGTWDDHDFGINDAGKENPAKVQSKEELLKFLDVPADDPVRKHEGVYSAHTYGEGHHKVKVILLDTRYFRDPLKKGPGGNKRYIPSNEGDFLGEEQWLWLEKELTNSDAAIHIIGSSIQFISEQHGYEKWANFTTSRNRMLVLLTKTKPQNTFFISGDRHIAEISKMNVKGLPYPLYDFTSSGLTHTWSGGGSEENRYRVGQLIIQKNFGLITIDWKKKSPSVTFTVLGEGNKIYETHIVKY
jgi:alkaline phosphatase D